MMRIRDYYEKVIADYENSNRQYPRELFDDMIAFSDIDKDSVLLEIGAGPGTATDELKNLKMDVLEVTDLQADYLKKKYKDYPNITVYRSTFENYDCAVKYDLIFSATAFHWISPRIAYSKAAKLLKKGGVLSPFWNLTFALRGGWFACRTSED